MKVKIKRDKPVSAEVEVDPDEVKVVVRGRDHVLVLPDESEIALNRREWALYEEAVFRAKMEAADGLPGLLEGE